MNKMKLDLDGLQVDSFATAGGPDASGTVRGHDSYVSVDLGCGETFHPQATCNIGCEGGESVGLSGCNCPTQACTNDPQAVFCYDSFHYCLVTPWQVCPDTESGTTACTTV